MGKKNCSKILQKKILQCIKATKYVEKLQKINKWKWGEALILFILERENPKLMYACTLDRATLQANKKQFALHPWVESIFS